MHAAVPFPYSFVKALPAIFAKFAWMYYSVWNLFSVFGQLREVNVKANDLSSVLHWEITQVLKTVCDIYVV